MLPVLQGLTNSTISVESSTLADATKYARNYAGDYRVDYRNHNRVEFEREVHIGSSTVYVFSIEVRS